MRNRSLGIYDWEDEILDASDRYDEDPLAMLNLGQTESAGNPFAQSPVGAQGLYQHMPGTAREMGINPFEPEESIDGGVGYFSKMRKNFDDDPFLATAAYNWGPRNLQDLIDREGTDDISELYDDLPKETQDHFYKVWHPSSDPENDAWLKGPLPKAPSFESPSKYADVEIEAAKMPVSRPGASSRRSEDLSRVTQEITALEDQKRTALESMSSQGRLDSDEAIAMALTAIIPALLGAGFGGLQGASMGAQAGAAGASVGLQGLTAEMNRRDNTNKLLYEDARQRLTTKEAEAKGIRDSIADEDFITRRDRSLYGSDGLRRGTTEFSDPLISEGLAAKARGEDATPEQMAAISRNKAALEMYDRLTRGNTYESQQEFQRQKRAEDISSRRSSRAVPKPGQTPSDKDAEEVKSANITTDNFNRELDNLEQSLIEKGDALTGKESQKQISAIYSLLLYQKQRFGGGAAYTELEAKLANEVLPKLSTTNLSDALLSAGLGRDPLEAIRNMRRIINDEFANIADNRGFTVTPYGGGSGSSGAQTKTVNGVKYEKTAGGWRKIQ